MARKSNASDLVLTILPDSAQGIPSGPRVNRNRLMPGLRVRHDGWTEERTQRFFDALGHTGCVRDAARVAGVSNAAAYRMKRRFPLFSQSWEDALDRAGQGLLAIAYKRAVEGRETVIIRGGQEYERRITPSDAILGLLLKRGDMAGGGALAGGKLPDDLLSFDEWQRHKRFDDYGRKIEIEDPEKTTAKFIAKLTEIRNRLKDYARHGGACPTCKQPLPDGWPNQSMAELVASGLVDPNELHDD
jgi:hypothetical protein